MTPIELIATTITETLPLGVVVCCYHSHRLGLWIAVWSDEDGKQWQHRAGEFELHDVTLHVDERRRREAQLRRQHNLSGWATGTVYGWSEPPGEAKELTYQDLTEPPFIAEERPVSRCDALWLNPGGTAWGIGFE